MLKLSAGGVGFGHDAGCLRRLRLPAGRSTRSVILLGEEVPGHPAASPTVEGAVGAPS